jgi:hypothetical protein
MSEMTFILVAFVVMAVTFGGLVLFGIVRAFHQMRERGKCPSCHKPWARRNIREELAGIFKKSYFEIRGRGRWRWKIAPHGKYKLYHKCTYCGYEWTSIETRMLS